MKYIDRYLFRSVAGPTLIAFILLALLATAAGFNGRISQVVGHVMELRDVARLGLYLVPSLLPMIVPIALFFGLLSGYGKLADRGEMAAMRAAGIPVFRLALPALLLGLTLSLVCVITQDRLQPVAMRHARTLIAYELPRRATIDTLGAGVVHSVGDLRVYFRASDPDTRKIYDVDVVRHEEGESAAVYHAKTASVLADEGGQALVLEEGFSVPSNQYRYTFDKVSIRIPFPTDASSQRASRESSNLFGLLDREREVSVALLESASLRDSLGLKKLRQEIADRLSQPFAAFAFACVAAPLAAGGGRRRRTGTLSLLAIGIVPALGYYLMYAALEPKVLMPLEGVLVRAWVPNLTLVLLGLALFWRSARPH